MLAPVTPRNDLVTPMSKGTQTAKMIGKPSHRSARVITYKQDLKASRSAIALCVPARVIESAA